MKITVCIGSSCHIKGSRAVVEKLQSLVKEHGLDEKVELGGTFCMGQCGPSVGVSIDGTVFSVSPEETESFFAREVLSRV